MKQLRVCNIPTDQFASLLQNSWTEKNIKMLKCKSNVELEILKKQVKKKHILLNSLFQ